MRVTRREIKQGINSVDKAISNRMLEQISIRVNLVPGITQRFDEEGLDQAVPTNHCDRELGANFGELNPRIWLMLNQATRLQPFDGFRRR